MERSTVINILHKCERSIHYEVTANNIKIKGNKSNVFAALQTIFKIIFQHDVDDIYASIRIDKQPIDERID